MRGVCIFKEMVGDVTSRQTLTEMIADFAQSTPYRLCVLDASKTQLDYDLPEITFELDPIAPVVHGAAVEHDSYVRLKHCGTGYWIQVG